MTKHTERFEVRNRYTNAVQFTAEIVCAPDAAMSVKMGLAVKWGIKNEADLRGADLRGANLRGVNLREAKIDGFAIATPEEAAPRIKAVAQAALKTPDALNMVEWHTCETTHCIAGWAVHLAGVEGKALEEKFGTANAGMILLGSEAASNFYDTQEQARTWLISKMEEIHD
jgi:hypothetical protein